MTQTNDRGASPCALNAGIETGNANLKPVIVNQPAKPSARKSLRMLRYRDLGPLKGIWYSRMHIWRLTNEGKFPLSVPMGANSVAWLESEIDAWIEAAIAKRDQAGQPGGE